MKRDGFFNIRLSTKSRWHLMRSLSILTSLAKTYIIVWFETLLPFRQWMPNFSSTEKAYSRTWYDFMPTKKEAKWPLFFCS